MNGNSSLDICVHLDGLKEIREKVREINRLADEIEDLAGSIRRAPVMLTLTTGTGEKDRTMLL